MLELNNLNEAYTSTLYPDIDNNAITLFINNVLSDMEPLLTSRYLNELSNALQETINNYSISSDEKLYMDIDYHDLNKTLLKNFIDDKRLSGLSEKTLTQYNESIKRFFEFTMKGADSVTADDVREYLSYILEERKCSMVTADNYRRYLNSFYDYCVSNGLLYKNPLKKVDRIKEVRKVKQPFSNEEIIYLRENLTTLRDKAIFELLLSSGMRIGELVGLDHKELNMNNCSVIVHGKGNKEREVFFNDLAKISITRYLDSRTDTNPALFVSLHSPYNRVTVSSVGTMLRNLGKESGVSKVHPHRFRRSFACNLLNKGVHIEQIQKLLGHANIETTKLYIVSDENEIKYNHKRYVN